MKKLPFLSIAALLLAFAFSAFKAPPQKIKAENPLWFYTEASTAGENEPSNYVPLTDQDEGALCPGESEVRCVIEAPDNSGVPDLDHIDNIVSMKP